MRSQTILKVASIGTASSAPATPHIQYQKMNEMTTSTRAEGEAPGEEDRRDAFAFDQMDRQIAAGRQQPLPQRIESQQPAKKRIDTTVSGPMECKLLQNLTD